ncbi:MAG: hypothetical protein Q9181_005244 [Wetmoreana brouardii]
MKVHMLRDNNGCNKHLQGSCEYRTIDGMTSMAWLRMSSQRLSLHAFEPIALDGFCECMTAIITELLLCYIVRSGSEEDFHLKQESFWKGAAWRRCGKEKACRSAVGTWTAGDGSLHHRRNPYCSSEPSGLSYATDYPSSPGTPFALPLSHGALLRSWAWSNSTLTRILG